MKITMYELLGMVKDGKAPKKIKYINSIWEYDKETKDYFHDDLWLFYSMNSIGLTEREVEIIEEEKKTKPLTKKDIEALGYACGEIQKCFTNGWTKSLENKSLEEEHKIPEKFEIYDNSIEWCCNGRSITDNEKDIMDKINEILDCLEKLK